VVVAVPIGSFVICPGSACLLLRPTDTSDTSDTVERTPGRGGCLRSCRRWYPFRAAAPTLLLAATRPPGPWSGRTRYRARPGRSRRRQGGL